LEASGNYSLDLALSLQGHRQVEVSVVNPRRARDFAKSLGERGKTDLVDACVLCEFAARMPWVAWQPPSSLALRLRAITRAIEALGVMQTQEKIARMPWPAAKLCRPWLSRKCGVISVIWSIACNGCGARLCALSPAIASWIAAFASC
jgi:hypothetical protein